MREAFEQANILGVASLGVVTNVGSGTAPLAQLGIKKVPVISIASAK